VVSIFERKHVLAKHDLTIDTLIRINCYSTLQDVSLMKEFFNLKCDYQDMSPVIIPSGYTKDYIDGKVSWRKT
jgi:hypothetical protein